MKIYRIAKEVKGHSYSWVFINLPKDIHDDMLLLGMEIDPDDLYVGEADNGLEKDPHVTVKYGLLDISPSEVKECLDKAKGGKVFLGKSSIFEGDEYDVVKISVESKALNELHEKLNKLPHEDKHMEYNPHATIAYVKKGKGKKYVGKLSVDKSFKIKECYFDNQKRNYKINLANNFLGTFKSKMDRFAGLRGEWWIIDGQSHFADGDVGDFNHEAYAIKYAQDVLGGDTDWENWKIQKAYEIFQEMKSNNEFEAGYDEEEYYEMGQEAKNDPELFLLNHMEEAGIDEDTFYVANGNHKDPRDWSMKSLGWKRMAGNDITTWTLTQSDFSSISNGIYDAYGNEEGGDDETFSVEVRANNTTYWNVPMSVFRSGKLSNIMEYKSQSQWGIMLAGKDFTIYRKIVDGNYHENL